MNDWDWFLSHWTLGFGQRAKDFWDATPYEFWSLYRHKYREILEPPMSRTRLKEMMEQFPDGNRA